MVHATGQGQKMRGSSVVNRRQGVFHIHMQTYISRLGPKVVLNAVTMLTSGCWSAPNAQLRPQGEPRVIEDSIGVELAMPPMRVQSIDVAGRIVVASSSEAMTVEIKIAPAVRNLEYVHPGDQIRPTVRENLTVYVASQSGARRPWCGGRAGMSAHTGHRSQLSTARSAVPRRSHGDLQGRPRIHG